MKEKTVLRIIKYNIYSFYSLYKEYKIRKNINKLITINNIKIKIVLMHFLLKE